MTTHPRRLARAARSALTALAVLSALVLGAPLVGAQRTPLAPSSFLHAQGGEIVDGDGRPVLLRGMGLGGWMLQEGYMLNAGGLTQRVMRQKMTELIGRDATTQFYTAWLDNHTTKTDIDALAAWGFNSVRLPMHYDLLTPSVEDEPVPGRNTWIEAGFRRIDALLTWCKANNMYLILDLHAAPGGQGNDLPIADRDPAKPSLWESPANQDKMVALWGEIARRYRDEPNVGAYDLLNEPNWDLDGSGDAHGCKVKDNATLVGLLKRTTAAIRQVDAHHLLVIEGNCWGNNYAGVVPTWDANLALSFHRYWNRPERTTLRDVVALRARFGVPLWLGEAGENSNDWFAATVSLVQGEGIGWAWWTLKKVGLSSPLQIRPNPGVQAVTDYWRGRGPKPSRDAAYRALMQLATHDVRFEQNAQYPDVVDALLRAPADPTGAPYRHTVIGPAGGRVLAADYDMGRNGVAYFDQTAADYHVSTGGASTRWNDGEVYRNDGVDLARDARGEPYVKSLDPGEWLRFTVTASGGMYQVRVSDAAGATADVTVLLNGVVVPAGGTGLTSLRPTVTLLPGRNTLVLRADRAATSVRALDFVPAGAPAGAR